MVLETDDHIPLHFIMAWSSDYSWDETEVGLNSLRGAAMKRSEFGICITQLRSQHPYLFALSKPKGISR